MQTRSVPLQVPFSVHLLTTEPFASNPSLQENLHTVLYNISIVLHPNSSPLVGGDNFEQVTAKNKINNVDGLRDSSNMKQFGVDDMAEPVTSCKTASVIRATVD